MCNPASQLGLGQQADGGGGPLGLSKLPELKSEVGVAWDGGGFVKIAVVREVMEGHRVRIAMERNGLVVNWRERGGGGEKRGREGGRKERESVRMI